MVTKIKLSSSVCKEAENVPQATQSYIGIGKEVTLYLQHQGAQPSQDSVWHLSTLQVYPVFWDTIWRTLPLTPLCPLRECLFLLFILT